MWIFTKHGFFSVTQSTLRKDDMMIRARVREHLEDLKANHKTLARSKIIRTTDSDYRFRLIVKRWRWELVGKALIEGIDYSNFKGKCAQVPHLRRFGWLNALHDIWSIHFGVQRKADPIDPFAGEPKLIDDPIDEWEKALVVDGTSGKVDS